MKLWQGQNPFMSPSLNMLLILSGVFTVVCVYVPFTFWHKMTLFVRDCSEQVSDVWGKKLTDPFCLTLTHTHTQKETDYVKKKNELNSSLWWITFYMKRTQQTDIFPAFYHTCLNIITHHSL